MDMKHETPKKLVVLATHGDEEPPKTLDETGYCGTLNITLIILINPNFNMVMGYTLDQHEYFSGLSLVSKRETLMGSNKNVTLVCLEFVLYV